MRRPGRVLFQGALANFNRHSPLKVDFKNDDRAPLLLIGGGEDHTVPAVVDESTAKHYRKSPRSPSTRSSVAARTTRSDSKAGRKRQVVADQQWHTVTEEKKQNQELLDLSKQILDATKAIQANTTT